jgi:hypothetical protein
VSVFASQGVSVGNGDAVHALFGAYRYDQTNKTLCGKIASGVQEYMSGKGVEITCGRCIPALVKRQEHDKRTAYAAARDLELDRQSAGGKPFTAEELESAIAGYSSVPTPDYSLPGIGAVILCVCQTSIHNNPEARKGHEDNWHSERFPAVYSDAVSSDVDATDADVEMHIIGSRALSYPWWDVYTRPEMESDGLTAVDGWSMTLRYLIDETQDKWSDIVTLTPDMLRKAVMEISHMPVDSPIGVSPDCETECRIWEWDGSGVVDLDADTADQILQYTLMGDVLYS